MEIKTYKQGDEVKILQLFETVFGKKMSMEYWKWRFMENPFSKDVLIHLMWENEELIGQYALSPVDMKVGDKLKKAALAMSLMTHPDYQGRGVFAQLGKSLHRELKDKFGYHMIFAFPNNKTHSHYGFVKNLGWKDIAIIPMMSVRTQDLRFKVGGKVNYSVLSTFDDVADEFFNSNKLVKINYSQEYLQWRYIDNPSTSYKIIKLDNEKGLAVYKVIPSFIGDGNYEIDLMEVKFDNDSRLLSEIIKAIFELEQDKELNSFNTWKSIFAEDQLRYEQLGFKISQPLNYLSYLDFEDQPLVSDFRNWDMGMGYSDVF